MDIRRRLATDFASEHPAQAASVLDGRPVLEVAPVLASLPRAIGAKVLQKLSPGVARQVLESLEPQAAAEIVTSMPLEAVAAALRGIDEDRREAILSGLEVEFADDLRTVIECPPGTAGAVMDPRSVALPADLTVAEAMSILQRQAQYVLYNVYTVDRDGMLIGVFNLQALMAASSRDLVSTIMQPANHRLLVTADHRAIVEHEGWRTVYSLPVVNEKGQYVGAIRYRTLRRLESESSRAGTEAVTAAALGDLFRTGIGGVIEALSGMVGAPGSEGGRGPTPPKGVES